MGGVATSHTDGAPARGGRGWPLALLPWVVVAASVLAAVTTTGALLLSHTATGRGLALDWALGRLRPAINGDIRIGSVGPGGILGGATLVDVEMADSLGRPVLVIDSLRARYSLAALVAGPPAIADLELWAPVVNLEPAPGEPVELATLLKRTEPGAETPGADPEPGASPALVVSGAVIHDGTVILRDAAGRERRVEQIDVELPRVAFRPDPTRFLTAEVASAGLSFPAGEGVLEVASIRGTLEVGPQGVTLESDQLRLPRSVGSGTVSYVGGASGGSSVLDLQFERLALADLRAIDGRLERGTARGGVRVEFDGRGVRVDVDAGVVETGSGRLAVNGGVSLGDSVRFRDLRVAPDALPTAELEPWLDRPLPWSGRLAGDVSFDGTAGRLAVDGALALLQGEASDTVAAVSGGGTFLGPRAFEDVALDVGALDYELLATLFPTIPWAGHGRLSLEATGDLPGGVDIRAAVVHAVDGGTASTALVQGTLYGDTTVSVVDLEASLEPLSLSLVRGFAPGLPLGGDVGGSISLAGSLSALDVLANLQTNAGPLDLRGVVNARDPATGYRLSVSTDSLRISDLVDGLPDPTVVSGTASLDGRGLDPESLRGALVLEAGPSTIAGLRLDSASLNIWADDDGLLHVESLFADAGGVVVRSGGGSLGLAPGALGEGVVLSLASPSLRPLRPVFMGEGLVAWDDLTTVEQDVMIEFDGVDPDTFPLAREIRFDGELEGQIRLTGGFGDLAARTIATIGELRYGVYSARTVSADFTAEGLNVAPPWITPRPSPGQPARPPPQLLLDGTITGDSIVLDDRALDSARVTATLAPGAGGRVHTLLTRSDAESYEAQAVLRLDDEGGRVDLDRLTLILPDRRWGLMGPASVEWDDTALTVNDFGLIRPGAEGLRMRVDGRLAREGGDSDLELEVGNLDLAVLGDLLQMPDPPAGILSADVRARGPGPDHRWDGSLRIANVAPRHGGLRHGDRERPLRGRKSAPRPGLVGSRRTETSPGGHAAAGPSPRRGRGSNTGP